jgi:hypothetical protein
VIIGKLIPAGTGMRRYRSVRVKPLVEVPVFEDHVDAELESEAGAVAELDQYASEDDVPAEVEAGAEA